MVSIYCGGGTLSSTCLILSLNAIKSNKQLKHIDSCIMDSFNIVDLIENNPVTKLSTTYQNKLLTKIQTKFSETEQQLFVSSFYCFLNYDSITDFVIDLDDVWKWVGFSNKAHSKHLLEKQFVIDKDYKLLLTKPGKQSEHSRGGHNKVIFMLNITTFKKFCLKAGTKKAAKLFQKASLLKAPLIISWILLINENVTALQSKPMILILYSYGCYATLCDGYYSFHFRCSRDFILLVFEYL